MFGNMEDMSKMLEGMQENAAKLKAELESKVFSVSGLGIFDRIFGFAFGAGKIFLLFAIISYAKGLSILNVNLSNGCGSMDKSKLRRHFISFNCISNLSLSLWKTMATSISLSGFCLFLAYEPNKKTWCKSSFCSFFKKEI